MLTRVLRYWPCRRLGPDLATVVPAHQGGVQKTAMRAAAAAAGRTDGWMDGTDEPPVSATFAERRESGRCTPARWRASRGKAAPALANWTLVGFGVSVLASVLAPAPAIGARKHRVPAPLSIPPPIYILRVALHNNFFLSSRSHCSSFLSSSSHTLATASSSIACPAKRRPHATRLHNGCQPRIRPLGRPQGRKSLQLPTPRFRPPAGRLHADLHPPDAREVSSRDGPRGR